VTGWPSYTPQAQGSLFVAFYGSQGYGGGILTRLHVGAEKIYRFPKTGLWHKYLVQNKKIYKNLQILFEIFFRIVDIYKMKENCTIQHL
jgi:hypothetical protein